MATFPSCQRLLEALRYSIAHDERVDFAGRCEFIDDSLIPPKERVQMITHEIWKISGYRFTYGVKHERSKAALTYFTGLGTIHHLKLDTRHAPGAVKTR